MHNYENRELRAIADFNPPEKIKDGQISKKIPMAQIREYQRKIDGFEIEKYKSGPKFRNGDVLVAKITPCLENGKTAFVDILGEDEIAFGSSEFIVLRAKNNTDNVFLYYLARSPAFRKKAIGCMEGTSGRKRVNEGVLKLYELPIPEKLTQTKIATVLSVLDTKIELNSSINAELEAMAKTIYDYWFVQFDFPDAKGKPYKTSGGKMAYNSILKREIPESWTCKKLDDVLSRTGTGLNPRNNFKLGDGQNYYITIKDIEQGMINFTDKSDRVNDEALAVIAKRSDLQKGDVLFTSIEPVGITYLIHKKPKNWDINESVFTIRANSSKVTSELLFMLLSGEELKSFTGNSSSGSIHKGIRHGVLKSYPFAYSGYSLIEKFTSIIKPILEKQHNIENENLALINLRDWLLPMLMNGQVTVRN